jgi:hypothetical protein
MDLKSMVETHLNWFEPAGELLKQFCEATGLRWGPNPAHLFWYRPPAFHVVEFILFHLFVYLCFKLSKEWYAKNVTGKRPVLNPHSTLDLALGSILMICWLSQVVFKALRPNALVQLCWLAMPCHLITLLWCYVLLSKGRKNYRECVYLATLAGLYHWGPVSAALFPDWNDHVFKRAEGLVFVVHHGLLCLMPFYWAFRYDLVPMSWRFSWHYTALATFINIDIYTLLSYVSGLNVNYHLYPPPKVMHWPFLNTVYYRFNVIAALIIISPILYLMCRIVNGIGRLVFRIKPKCD